MNKQIGAWTNVRRLLLVGSAVLLVQLATGSAAASLPIFYSNDFTGAVGSEWSNTNVSTIPVGSRKFLGEFAKQTVSLNLSGLPSHDTAAVSFDVFFIRTWDGNNS